MVIGGAGGGGNVERGLKEDQEQLMMGKRIGGFQGGGASGFGGEDGAKLWAFLPPAITDNYSLVAELGRGI